MGDNRQQRGYGLCTSFGHIYWSERLLHRNHNYELHGKLIGAIERDGCIVRTALRYLTFILISTATILLATCDVPIYNEIPVESPFESAILSIEVAELSVKEPDAGRMASPMRLETSQISSATISVTGHGLPALETTVPIVSGSGAAAIGPVEIGNNRIVVITGLDATASPVPGATIATTLDLYPGPNLATVTWQTTPRGLIFLELESYDDTNGTEFARSLSSSEIQQFIETVSSQEAVPHPSLVSASAIAAAIIANNGIIPSSSNSTFRINSGEVQFSITGLSGNSVDAIVWDPSSDILTVGQNGSYTISNVLPGDWDFVIRDGSIEIERIDLGLLTEGGQIDVGVIALSSGGSGSISPLGDVLQRLNAGYSTITSAIPGKYEFLDGIVGSSIIDGGGDMYDGSNILETDIGGFGALGATSNAIPYSNGSIISHSAFGAGGMYSTQKVPGLFVLMADLDGVNTIRIQGNLGADGSGLVDSATLSLAYGSRDYDLFVQRVWNAGDPSINHLLIVESDPATDHSIYPNTHYEDHQVTGLSTSGISRFYYLLFSTTTTGLSTGNGTYVDDATISTIAALFLALVEPGA